MSTAVTSRFAGLCLFKCLFQLTKHGCWISRRVETSSARKYWALIASFAISPYRHILCSPCAVRPRGMQDAGEKRQQLCPVIQTAQDGEDLSETITSSAQSSGSLDILLNNRLNRRSLSQTLQQSFFMHNTFQVANASLWDGPASATV